MGKEANLAGKVSSPDTLSRVRRNNNKSGIIVFERSLEDVNSVPAAGQVDGVVKVVHLTRQDKVKISAVRDAIKSNPGTQVVEIASSFEWLVGPGIRKVLEEKGVELRFSRQSESLGYDRVRVSAEYKEEKRLFDEHLQDSQWKDKYQKMLGYNFMEAKLAQMYYGDGKITMPQIAQKLGIKQRTVTRGLGAFRRWMGLMNFGSFDEPARGLSERLARFEKIKKDQKATEDYRNQFKVGDTLPPVRLQSKAWGSWQKVNELYRRNPRKFMTLRKKSQRGYEVVMDYYIHNGQDGFPVFTLNEIGDRYSVSREAIRIQRNQALGMLGLTED